MGVTLSSSGTQVCSVQGTEYSIISSFGTGVYIVTLDLSDLAAGEVLVCRAKAKVLSGGSAVLMYTATYSGVQAEPCVSSIPLPIGYTSGGSFTLQQTSGSGASIPWNYMTLT